MYMSVLTYQKVEEKQQTRTSDQLYLNQGKCEILNPIVIDASP